MNTKFKMALLATALSVAGHAGAETYRVIVKPVAQFKSASVSSVGVSERSARQSGLHVHKSKALFGNIVALEVEADSREAAVKALKSSGAFSEVAPDIRIQTSRDRPLRAADAASDQDFPDDPYFNDQLAFFGVPGQSYRGLSYDYGHSILPLMAASAERSPVRIGVIDGGFVRINDINWGTEHLDFIDNDTNPFMLAESFPECENSHGTGVAGAAAAIVNNGAGTAGVVSNAQVFAARALDCGLGYLSDGAYAIAALAGSQFAIFEDDPEASLPALSEPVDIINMSFGAIEAAPAECPFYLTEAIRIANENGVLLVSAAGNESSRLGREDGAYIDMPSMCGEVIGVAATDSTDDLASFSNYGEVDVAFRGDFVPAPAIFDGEEGIGYWEGTSFSSPLVAGVAALMEQKFNGLTYAEFKEALALSAEPYPADSLCVTRGNVCGDGFLNVQALSEALAYMRGDVSASPVLDDSAGCSNDFLTRHLELDYPVCEHYKLNIGEYAFKEGRTVSVYRVDKGADITNLDLTEFEQNVFSSGDPLLMRIQTSFDYYYEVCGPQEQCGQSGTALDVEPPPASCTQ